MRPFRSSEKAFASSNVCAAVNTTSAVRAARSRPTSEAPAWTITGAPCGERGRSKRVANRKALAVMSGSGTRLALPKSCDHLGELARPLIAVGMGLEAGRAEIGGLDGTG